MVADWSGCTLLALVAPHGFGPISGAGKGQGQGQGQGCAGLGLEGTERTLGPPQLP